MMGLFFYLTQYKHQNTQNIIYLVICDKAYIVSVTFIYDLIWNFYQTKNLYLVIIS